MSQLFPSLPYFSCGPQIALCTLAFCKLFDYCITPVSPSCIHEQTRAKSDFVCVTEGKTNVSGIIKVLHKPETNFCMLKINTLLFYALVIQKLTSRKAHILFFSVFITPDQLRHVGFPFKATPFLHSPLNKSPFTCR